MEEASAAKPGGKEASSSVFDPAKLLRTMRNRIKDIHVKNIGHGEVDSKPTLTLLNVSLIITVVKLFLTLVRVYFSFLFRKSKVKLSSTSALLPVAAERTPLKSKVSRESKEESLKMNSGHCKKKNSKSSKNRKSRGCVSARLRNASGWVNSR